MSSEAKLITAVCENKDIASVMSDNPDNLFHSHGDVWEAVKDYWNRYGNVPDVSILEEQFRDFESQEVNGETRFYLDELKDNYIESRLKRLFIDKNGKLGSNPSAKVLEELQSDISDLARQTNVVRDVDVTDVDSAEEYYRKQKELADQMGGVPGIPTGISALDSAYRTGMAPGHLIVMIGWSGRGKSWFAAMMACKAWERGFRPMFLSMEMAPEIMRDRIYTIMGSGLFDNTSLSAADFNLDEFSSWGRKKFDNSQSFIIVASEGTESVTPNTVQSKIDQYRPDIVFLDYHQLFDDNSHSESEVVRNRNVSRQFKRLATGNNIPVVDITAATMDDVSDTDEPPVLEQVAWSKSIQYDADLALSVHKGIEQDNENFFEVVCRKNRYGPMPSFFLDWDINKGIIKELTSARDDDGEQ